MQEGPRAQISGEKSGLKVSVRIVVLLNEIVLGLLQEHMDPERPNEKYDRSHFYSISTYHTSCANHR